MFLENVKNKVFVCGDTHCNIDIHKLSVKKWRNQKFLNENDILIILGDFGLFWGQDLTKESIYWLKWLCDKPFQVCFIDGNHEAFPLFINTPIEEWFGGRVHNTFEYNGKKIRHLIRGEIFTINNNKILTFGGGQSIDKQHRILGVSWWEEENITQKDLDNITVSLNSVRWEVDFMLTHAAPLSWVEKLPLIDNNSEKINQFNDYEKFFDMLIKEDLRFKEWHSGHYHVDFNDGRFFTHYNNIPHRII